MRHFPDELRRARRELTERENYFPLTLANAQYITISNEIPRSARAFVFRQFTRYGQAVVANTSNTGVPLVERSVSERTIKIFTILLGFEYTLDEQELADDLGTFPVSQKMADTKEGIDQKLDIIAYIGHPGTSLYGLATQPNVTQIDFPADGTGASAAWSTKTPAQILRDMHTFALKVPEQTYLSKRINRIVMPASKYLYLQTTPYNTVTGDSILTTFLRNQASMPNGGITDIIGSPLLETYGTGGVGLMIGYDTTSQYNRLHIPQGGDFRDFTPSLNGTKWTVPCWMRTAGVQVERPLELIYANVS